MSQDFEIYTPNMPGSWGEDFSVSMLADAFSITTDQAEDIAAFRRIFGTDQVGNTQLIGCVEEHLDEQESNHLDLAKAQMWLEDEDSVNLEEMATISDEAAKALAKDQCSLWLNGLTELSEAAAKAFGQHQGKLDINGVAELSDTAANHLAGKSGMISEKDPKEWVEKRRKA